MNSTARAAIAFGIGVATYVVLSVPLMILIGIVGLGWAGQLLALACAFYAGRYAWRNASTMSGGFLGSVVLGAIVVGAIGFSLGFFGPMILVPDANQGPVLGIFITGPLGFVMGAVGGGVRWMSRRG